MTVFPRFVFPWALLLLLLIPWFIYMGVRLRSLSTGRKWTAIVLRSLILFCLIAALAGAELVKKNDKLAVFFLLDHSSSIPEDLRLQSAQSVRNVAEEYMGPRDEAGVIVFGDTASIELAVAPTLGLRDIRSFVGGEQTDLASAVRLAMAAFPQGYKKRMVIYTDGNETRGKVVEEVKLAQAAGVAVDVVPLPIGGTQEVRLREVTVPGRVNAGEPFQVRVVVQAEQDCEATIRLSQRTAGGQKLLPPEKVTLHKGDNPFYLTQQLDASGFYEYEAAVESTADTVLANNESQAFTIIQGEPRALYVEADPEHSKYLGPALRKEGVQVDEVHVGEIPTNLAQFENYDVVILSDISSTDLSTEQLNSMEALVRDLGVGLVMIGGPSSFGAGGFQNSPVERALPVSMDIKQRKILPRGALVLILHTCEIPDGNAWATTIGKASLEVLSSQDYMGVLHYGYPNGEGWLYPLQPVRDKSMMRAALSQAQPGDMPDVQNTLQLAYQSLKNASAMAKRVVIISDGDPGPPTAGLLKALAADKISVSTICIAPHSPSDQDMLRWIANSTGGKYYYVTNPNKLPQIFAKEAAVVKRGLLIEKPFTPRVMHDSELLQGITDGGIPQLNGYVATTPKDSATIPLVSNEKDPILAHWRYGLGKSVAFTSDVTNRWAAQWLSWDAFTRFWAQTVRWSMRELQPSGFRVDTRVKDGMGYVRIDAVDEQGKFVNFLRPKGVVTGPGPDFKRQEISLMQSAPGIYEGTFPLDTRGVYMVNMSYDRGDGTRGLIPAGVALGYSREYEYNHTNRGLLEEVASVGGGTMRKLNDNPFDHNLPDAASVTPLWVMLVVIAACMFPFEIFVRRVVVDFGVVYAFALNLLRRLPGLRTLLPRPRARTAPATGTYGTAPSREFAYSRAGGLGALDAEYGPSASGTPESSAVSEAEETTPAPKAAGRTEYTSKLLEAKQRAIEKQARRAGTSPEPDKDKEKP